MNPQVSHLLPTLAQMTTLKGSIKRQPSTAQELMTIVTDPDTTSMGELQVEVMRLVERHVATALEAAWPHDLKGNCVDVSDAIKNDLLSYRPAGLALSEGAVKIVEGTWFGPCQRSQSDTGHAWLRVEYHGGNLEFDPTYVQYLKERWSWHRSVEVVSLHCIPKTVLDVQERYRNYNKETGY